MGFPGGSVGKESTSNAGDLGSVPGSGRSPGAGNGNPLQYSCLENSMDRRAWRATVHGVTKSQTRISNQTQEQPDGRDALSKVRGRSMWLPDPLQGHHSPSVFTSSPTQKLPTFFLLLCLHFFPHNQITPPFPHIIAFCVCVCGDDT